MKNLVSKISPITSLFLIPSVAIVFDNYFYVKKFQSFCVNAEFLSWDVSLRFIAVIQMMDAIRNFNLFEFLHLFFASPTWPPLRYLVQMPLFATSGLDPLVDIWITRFTFYFLILVGPIFYHILFRPTTLTLILFSTGYSGLLLLCSPLILYSFTGMLEVQGALFHLLSVVFISIYIQKEKEKNWIKWAGIISVLFLGLTKYPYTLIFLTSSIPLLVIYWREESIRFLKESIFNPPGRFPYLRWAVYIGIMGVYLYAKLSNLSGKGPNYIRYLIFLMVLIELFFCAKKNGKNTVSTNLSGFLFRYAFPFLCFYLLNPDRVSASSGAYSHVQSADAMGSSVSGGLSFYLLFFKAFFEDFNFYFGIPILLILAFSLVEGLVAIRQGKKTDSSFFYSWFTLSTIVLLSIATKNHQPRHIYHLYPTAIFGIFLYLSGKEKIGKILIVCIILISTIGLFFFRENGPAKTELCFAGTDKAAFAMPREVRNTLKKSPIHNPSIFINEVEEEHVHRADIELLLNINAYENKSRILTNPGKHKNVKGYNYIVQIGRDCFKNSELEKFQKNFPEKKINLNGLVETPSFCKKQYILK